MDSQEKTFKNPIEEQRKAALEHYEQASRAANHWSSFVESAIKAYSPESCPPPVSAEVVSHNEWFNSQSDVRQLLLLHPDGEMIERSCLHFLGDDAQAWWVNRKSSPSAPVVAEQVAQWAVNNRYPKSEFDKVSDHEFYHTLLDKINALSTPPQEGEPGEISTIERYIQLRKKHGNVEALRILQTEYANQSMQEGDAKAIAEAAFEAGYVSFLNNWKV